MFDKLQKFPLAHDRVLQIEPCKLILVRAGGELERDVVENPVVELAVVFKFERADRMGDPFNGI